MSPSPAVSATSNVAVGPMTRRERPVNVAPSVRRTTPFDTVSAPVVGETARAKRNAFAASDGFQTKFSAPASCPSKYCSSTGDAPERTNVWPVPSSVRPCPSTGNRFVAVWMCPSTNSCVRVVGVAFPQTGWTFSHASPAVPSKKNSFPATFMGRRMPRAKAPSRMTPPRRCGRCFATWPSSSARTMPGPIFTNLPGRVALRPNTPAWNDSRADACWTSSVTVPSR